MSSQALPLVSVVTPVYNAESYLAKCIESILAQTYDNWEYIIVNNCSTDGSLQIAQHYANLDARIRIHDNEKFLTQFQNWNHAMRQISPRSKYCKVVHADDWLFSDCIARMVQVAEANPSVSIVSAYRLDEDEVNLDGLPYPSTVTSGREICRRTLLGDLFVFGSPSSLLIRSDIIRNRDSFYEESTIHADTQMCFDILLDSDFGFVHQVLTFTRRHNESLTSLTNRFNTRRLGKFISLVKFGPKYLSPEEFERRLTRVLQSYHEFLGHSLFELKGKEFWRYHTNELQKLGYSISLVKLIKVCFLELLDFRTTSRTVRHALREKTQQNAPGNAQKLDTVLNSIYSRENDQDQPFH